MQPILCKDSATFAKYKINTDKKCKLLIFVNKKRLHG